MRFGARHRFLDGTLGIRVEQFKKVYIFPVSLSRLMSTVSEEIKTNLPIHLKDKPCDAEVLAYILHGKNKEIPYDPPPPAHCWQCKKIECESQKLKMCGRCGTAKYCDKQCQTDHWKVSHKYSCKCLTTYSAMVQETKTALDNMARYLDAFVSTDEEDNDEVNRSWVNDGGSSDSDDDN